MSSSDELLGAAGPFLNAGGCLRRFRAIRPPVSQSHPPPMPAQSLAEGLVLTGFEGIVAKELNDPGKELDLWLFPVQFPVGYPGASAYNLCGDLLLTEAQIEPTGSEVVAKGVY